MKVVTAQQIRELDRRAMDEGGMPGVVLMGEYSVTALTPQLLSLRHVAAKRDIQLPVPRAPGS